MKQPPWNAVELGPAAERSLREIFAKERSGTGWPSIGDVERLWLPAAKVVVAQGWASAAPISAGDREDVRAVVMKQYLSIFPPASIAVFRASPDDASHIRLVMIGVSFDRDVWESQRIAGLND